MKSAFQSVPADLESTALVDGCSRLGAFFRIAVPLAMPGIAATTVFAFISAWDEYLFARTFVSNSIYWVVSVGLGSFQQSCTRPLLSGVKTDNAELGAMQ